MAAMVATSPPATSTPPAAEQCHGGVDDPLAPFVPWGPHRLVPEAERWRRVKDVHEKLRRRNDELEAALEAERRKRREVEVQMSTEVGKWRLAARQMEIERDAFDKMSKTATVDAMAKVSSNKYDFVVQVADYERRIQVLERVIDEERSAHTEELRRFAELLHETQDDAEARVKGVQQRRDEAIAAATKRAEEAEESAAEAQRRADKQVAENRQREAHCLSEARHLADKRLRECEQKHRDEIEHLRRHTAEQQGEMQETLQMNNRHKTAALTEAKRHLSAMEQDSKDWGEAYAVDFEMKAVHLKEYQERQRAQNKAVTDHHKGLLDMEKHLHGRTMERTMGRVVRHMRMGDADTRGSETPTKELLRTPPLSAMEWPHTARERESGSLGLGGRLGRIGGALVADAPGMLASG